MEKLTLTCHSSGETENTCEKTCDKHGVYQAKVLIVMDRQFETDCPLCQRERKANMEKSKEAEKLYQRTHKIEKLLAQASIPPRFYHRNFENFHADTEQKKEILSMFRGMSSKFDRCLENGTSLLLCGKPGTGKSHLAAAFAISVIEQGRSALYTTVLRSVRSIKATYRSDSQITEQEAINLLISPDLVIMDEVGIQFGTDTEKMYLFEILNGRYENNKPTIMITNLSQEAATGYLGERIIDRMYEGGGGVVVFDWESYRKHVVHDHALISTKPKPVNWETVL